MRTITKGQTCGTCLFCERSTTNVGQGKCRFGPPTAIAMPVKGPLNATAIQQMTFYPLVTLNDRGCGAYQPSFQLEESKGGS
jgi:hypothetical protein